jgi:hypothetical protein
MEKNIIFRGGEGLAGHGFKLIYRPLYKQNIGRCIFIRFEFVPEPLLAVDILFRGGIPLINKITFPQDKCPDELNFFYINYNSLIKISIRI